MTITKTKTYKKTKAKTMTKTQIHTKTKCFRHAMYAIFFFKSRGSKDIKYGISFKIFYQNLCTKNCPPNIFHKLFTKMFPPTIFHQYFLPKLVHQHFSNLHITKGKGSEEKKRKKSGLLPNPPSDPPTPVWSFL